MFLYTAAVHCDVLQQVQAGGGEEGTRLQHELHRPCWHVRQPWRSRARDNHRQPCDGSASRWQAVNGGQLVSWVGGVCGGSVFQRASPHHFLPSTHSFRYAWTIVECVTCHKHMGWRFTVADKGAHVEPKKFWGLCRTGLLPGLVENEPESVQTFVWMSSN